jgi:hypothetical protein
MKKALKTMAIKARVYNKIRKALYKQGLEKFTSENKVTFFDELFKENQEAHNELNNLKRKRKDKAFVQAERVKRGYKPKRKTSLEEYNQSRQKIAS